MKVKILRNTSTINQIFDHLTICDGGFLPPLSRRVKISDYAEKLYYNAERFEAFVNGSLVGLVAVYSGAQVKDPAFVTNVSVISDFNGQGIATRLMIYSICEFQEMGKAEICLEVSQNSRAALKLYQRLGFVHKKKENSVVENIKLKLDLLTWRSP